MTAYTFTNLQPTSPYIPGEVIKVGAYFELTTGLASGDTITALNLIPPSGVQALELVVVTSQLDSNATPTGAYEVGDSLLDGSAAARYIALGKMGSNSAGTNVVQYSNVPPVITSGAYTAGVGFFYADDENTSGTNNGYLNMVMTLTASPATAAATGTIWLYFTYICVGNI